MNWVNQYMDLFPYESTLPTKGSARVENPFSARKICAVTTPKMSSDDLKVVDVPENRFDDAINHLKWNFFSDEPLNQAVGLCQKGESQFELERHCLLTLKQGYSRMLVDQNGMVSWIKEEEFCTLFLFIIKKRLLVDLLCVINISLTREYFPVTYTDLEH